MGETCTRYFRIDRRDLVYLKFILEAYEGMSTLSTADRERGIVRLNMLGGFCADMAALMDALGREITITEVAPPQATAVAAASQPSGEEAANA